MNFTADIQARAQERARLAAAYEAFVAAGKTIDTLPGPGEQCPAGVNHLGAPAYLPAGEQTQHMHRQRKRRALDKTRWSNREALIEKFGQRVKDAASQEWSEAGTAMELRISRAQVRMIAGAMGVTLRLRAKRRKATA